MVWGMTNDDERDYDEEAANRAELVLDDDVPAGPPLVDLPPVDQDHKGDVWSCGHELYAQHPCCGQPKIPRWMLLG